MTATRIGAAAIGVTVAFVVGAGAVAEAQVWLALPSADVLSSCVC